MEIAEFGLNQELGNLMGENGQGKPFPLMLGGRSDKLKSLPANPLNCFGERVRF